MPIIGTSGAIRTKRQPPSTKRCWRRSKRSLKRALNALGYPVGSSKARSLMCEASIRARYRKKYKVTTNHHPQPVFENVLKRVFTVAEPDQAYVSAITYIWTQEGWLYLAVYIDMFSRRVVGWSMGSRMNAQLVTDSLQMALWQRRPGAGLIAHSDKGLQYASKAYRRLLKAHGFVWSMSRKGDCWGTQSTTLVNIVLV